MWNLNTFSASDLPVAVAPLLLDPEAEAEVADEVTPPPPPFPPSYLSSLLAVSSEPPTVEPYNPKPTINHLNNFKL